MTRFILTFGWGCVNNIREMRDKLQYGTTSLPLAAYLCCRKDLKFAGIDKTNPSFITFLFEPPTQAQLAAEEYFSGQAQVVAIEIFQHYRVLKDLLFEAKRNSGLPEVD